MQLKAVLDTGKSTELPPFCQISLLDRHTDRHDIKCRQNCAYSPRSCLDLRFQLSDDNSSNWTEAKLLKMLATVKMFDLEHICSNSTEPAKMMTIPAKNRDSLLIGQELEKDELHRLFYYLSLIGEDKLIKST